VRLYREINGAGRLDSGDAAYFAIIEMRGTFGNTGIVRRRPMDRKATCIDRIYTTANFSTDVQYTLHFGLCSADPAALSTQSFIRLRTSATEASGRRKRRGVDRIDRRPAFPGFYQCPGLAFANAAF
jgi:hypothetical protein